MKNFYYIKLNDVCELITDGTHQTPTYSEDGYIFLSSKNVTNGVVDWKNIKYIPEELHKKLYERISPKVGDILLAKNGTTGVAALVDKNIIFDIYVSLALLRPKTNILPKYLLWAINNPYTKRKFQANLKGIGVPNLHLSSIKKTEIKFYDMPQQIYISNLMEKCKKIIDLKKQQLSELDSLVKFQFLKMFGDPILNEKNWKKVSFKEIISKIGSGSTPLGGNKNYKSKGISFIRSLNVHNNKFINDGLVFIDEKQSEKLKNVNVEKDDILFNITGASVARSCIVPLNILPARVNQHVSIIRCNKEIIKPIFLCSQLTNIQYQSFLLKIAKNNGATREALTKEQLENLNIILPPIELQNKFADFVKQVDKSKVELQKSIDETQLLFDSLMDKYFG